MMVRIRHSDDGVGLGRMHRFVVCECEMGESETGALMRVVQSCRSFVHRVCDSVCMFRMRPILPHINYSRERIECLTSISRQRARRDRECRDARDARVVCIFERIRYYYRYYLHC